MELIQLHAQSPLFVVFLSVAFSFYHRHFRPTLHYIRYMVHLSTVNSLIKPNIQKKCLKKLPGSTFTLHTDHICAHSFLCNQGLFLTFQVHLLLFLPANKVVYITWIECLNLQCGTSISPFWQ